MLNLKNKHANDTRITFDSQKHEYFVDGISIKYSVTGLIEKFFPKFDAEYWSNKKARERIQMEDGKLTQENISEVKKEILLEWENNRKDAAEKGTILHEKIENFYNNVEDTIDAPEFTYFKQFISKYPNLKPYKSEWRFRIGSIDKNISWMHVRMKKIIFKQLLKKDTNSAFRKQLQIHFLFHQCFYIGYRNTFYFFQS